MDRILIIDDGPDVRTLVSNFLKKNNFKVETASSRIEALQKVVAYQPMVILLDVLLSGSEGRTFCTELKQNEQTKNTAVIMCSAHTAAAESIKECGGDDFLPKPFTLPVLLTHIQKQLDKHS